ncbi:hypothetical protein CYMTET_53500 [Cymbomonas tetramitiformis]|uniref:RING-type domain-containing protein n=1 Tax=Cymbomonas tetramitiformis TaxID=36881 RepID=A0AAE0BIM1_9CHLO|nr:hypothetical protein CYMTET_53500 [Cymbomonas tetramitiformis]
MLASTGRLVRFQNPLQLSTMMMTTTTGGAAAGVTTRSASRAASLQGSGPGQRRGGRPAEAGAASRSAAREVELRDRGRVLGGGRAVRSMESLTREVRGAEEAGIAWAGSDQARGLAQEERQEPGPQQDCWGLGAGVLGRRVRVRWPAEGASFDGVVHAWVPGEGRHVVRYDDGDEVSHDLCGEQVEWLAGESGQRAQVTAAAVGVPDLVEPEVAAEQVVSAAEVSPSVCTPAPLDVLQSPPVPEGLADLLRTPGAVPRAGLDAEAEVDDAEQVHRMGVADVSGTPRPSPDMGRRLYVGPLFRPVEEEWCGHSMCSMPPTGVVADDGSTATFSWVFCPLILDAVGWSSAFPNLPRSDEWARLVDRLARVFRGAGISWEVVADCILEEAIHSFHFPGRRQEELLELDRQVGLEVHLFAANMVAEARQGLQPPGRVPGAMGSVGPAGSRSPPPEVAPRRDDQPPTVGEGDAAAVAEEVRTAVPEACDGPVVEAEEAGGAGQVGGAQLEGGPSPEACAAPIQGEDEVEEHALLSPSALEAFLRGQEAGGSHMVQRDALGRDLTLLELEALDRGLERPERIVSQGGVAFLSDGGGWPTLRISAGALMTPSLRAVFDADRRRGEGGPLSSVPIVQALVEEYVQGAAGVGVAEAAAALPAEVVMAEYAAAAGDVEDRPGYVRGMPQLSGRDCSVCLGEFRVGQAFSMWPCGHLTHQTCGARWLLERAACPSCRVRPPTLVRLGRRRQPQRQTQSQGREEQQQQHGRQQKQVQQQRQQQQQQGGQQQWQEEQSHEQQQQQRQGRQEQQEQQRQQREQHQQQQQRQQQQQPSEHWGQQLQGGGLRQQGQRVGRALPQRVTRSGVLPVQRHVRRTAADRAHDPPPGDDEPAYRCLVCSARTGAHPVAMARNLRGAHQPVDYQGLDLTAFGRQEAGAEAGAGGAQRRERPVDPVIPEASKKSIPAELVRGRVAKMVAGEWEALSSEAVPSAPVWPARASEERVMSDVISLVKEGQLGKAAPLVLEETAVEAECRRMPVASGPGIPAEVQPWIMGARLVALLKPGGGVRPIACGEGDPLGPFFMAAPLQPVLREVLRAHPEVYIIAYLDDIHILGEPERVREAYDAAVPLLADIGPELNVGKSAVFSPSRACEAFQDVVDAGDAGGHPLVASLVSAMGAVRGARETVLAARARGHVLPEALKVEKHCSF